MQKLTTLIILLALITGLTCPGQTTTDTDFVAGEVMVQLNKKAELPLLLKKYNLVEKQLLSDRFNIYLLQFDKSRLTNSSVISSLKSEKAVVNIQNNHNVSLRGVVETIPNDSLFNMQWSLLNTGQGSGTAGADIKADLAWDLNTGGVTAQGDTIVVAIIDGGSDLNHEDLDFWKNHGEIPDNNIDDDNNGYIDDYDGWNAYNNSGTIPISSHGVHVCGIAGAIGNNDIGIAGVNWNVKTLPIAGESSNEATVVKALSYIYVVREQYDQSNGAAGAFVVSQNNSFGVDKGQPDNYPIWEAMYDSLGTIGILSMGATANRAWNIDSVGDVPTAFATDYMVSVTNTTNKDKLYGSAGWGDTTIDLSAPGTMIWSLGVNNTYRTSTGTSMATPHVTGAVALLMAAADSLFIVNYKNNPAEGALLIKEYLLNGVDLLPDLEGKTVSGGRLNLFKSIKLLLSAPALTTNIDSIVVRLPLNYTHEENLIITNSGEDTLIYTLSINDQPGWISLSKNEGELLADESETVIVTLNTQSVDAGTYSSVISIICEDIEPKYIPVKMSVYNDTGIDDNISPAIKIFPNPFNSSIEFSFMPNTPGKSKIEIYNQYGKLVFSDLSHNRSGLVKFLWNNTSIGGGVYFYKILHNNSQVSVGKVIKI